MLRDKITTVLFDLDGTLLDTAPDFAFAVNQLRNEQGKSSLELSGIRPHVSHGIAGLLRYAFDTTPQDAQYQTMLETLLQYYSQVNGQFTTYFPGMEDLLTYLESQSMRWGVVTNKHAWLTNPLMEAKLLHTRSACTVSGDTTPFSKPHPAPLLHACKMLQVKPHHCLYIGDAQRDILAGRAAGMRTAAALFGYLSEHDDPLSWNADIYLQSPGDLIAI